LITTISTREFYQGIWPRKTIYWIRLSRSKLYSPRISWLPST